MERFPQVVTPSSVPFDPGQLVEALQGIVCRPEDRARKYTNVYVAGVYVGLRRPMRWAARCGVRFVG